ncbi:MAG TPA: helix-turn-helix domain-containing protein [Candidatus Saccharimonadales bacterium]|nr:helix-turn-helix domain-containing protein [Candidatus Saccharimonadales bacterium]
MNTDMRLLSILERSGLSQEAAKVYLLLCRKIASHLEVSRATRINRTKVYRIVQDLEHMGLVARQTDDTGTFLKACDIGVLELELTAKEQQVRDVRNELHSVVPELNSLSQSNDGLMTIRTYEGVEGLKQMCWHELKARGETLTLGSGSIEDLIPNHYWAEKHRALSVEAGYKVLEIVNASDKQNITFTSNPDFMKQYECRVLDDDILFLARQTVIYNDTVSIYHWRESQKVGVEIINKEYADMMRTIFNNYWNLSQPAATT